MQMVSSFKSISGFLSANYIIIWMEQMAKYSLVNAVIRQQVLLDSVCEFCAN